MLFDTNYCCLLVFLALAFWICLFALNSNKFDVSKNSGFAQTNLIEEINTNESLNGKTLLYKIFIKIKVIKCCFI